MIADAVPPLRDAIVLAVMIVSGSVALCCFVLIAVMEAYNAWDWWQSESSERFKSLPRTWMRRLRWPFRRARRKPLVITQGDWKQLFADKGFQEACRQEINQRSPFYWTFVDPNVPPGTLEVRQRGRTVGRIVNLTAE